MSSFRTPLAVPLPARAGSPRAGRWGRLAGLSVLLHLVALLALALLVRRPEPREEGEGTSYELVFDGGIPSSAATAPETGAESSPPPAPPPVPAGSEPVAPGPLTASPTAPPAEAAPAMPVLPAEAAPPTEVPPVEVPPLAIPSPSPAPAPTVPAAVEAAPYVAPPLPAPSATGTAEVRLSPPSAAAALQVPDFVPPEPPPPLPAAPPRPLPPRAAPPPQRAPPPGSFANPMDLNFRQAPTRGERLAAPRLGAAPGSTASRSIDLSPGPNNGPNRSDAFFDARARALGADWMAGVKSFWLKHRYYPQQAAQNGEDGDVDLELTVDRNGRVQSAVVTSRSGSSFIDMAAVSVFRGAKLPPLPEEVDAPYKTTITIHYMLIR